MTIFGTKGQALALPPDEGRADQVIPHRPHQRAAEAGNPPVRVVAVDHARDPDIRDGADRADYLEADQAGDELPAGAPRTQTAVRQSLSFPARSRRCRAGS